MDIADTWIDFEGWLERNCRELAGTLRPGASPEQIAALESERGHELPGDFKRIYRVHDGQEEESPGLFDALELLSLAGILREWKWHGEFIATRDMDKMNSGVEAAPEITSVYWKSSWIPFARHGSGFHYCVDLGPTQSGTPGQVIAMWPTPPERSVLGRSPEAWFREYVRKVLAGEYEYSEDELGLVEIED